MAVYAEELERMKMDYGAPKAVYSCEDAYRFLTSTLEALLETDAVLSERAHYPEAACQRSYLRHDAGALASAFTSLEWLCRAIGVSACRPMVIDPETLGRAARRANGFLYSFISSREGVTVRMSTKPGDTVATELWIPDDVFGALLRAVAASRGRA